MDSSRLSLFAKSFSAVWFEYFSAQPNSVTFSRMTNPQKNYSKRKSITSIFSLLAVSSGVLISGSSLAQAKSTEPVGPTKMSIALIGDMPYDATGAAQTPLVIKRINHAKDVAFVLFDGDTMSGKVDQCSDANYARIKSDFFDKFKKPTFYSVGDNEWVDCDRAVKGGYNTLDRLALVRTTYFGSNGTYISLGQGRLAKTPILHDAAYPELQMFTYNGITVIIPHVPGSANNAAVAKTSFRTYNDAATDGDAAEYAARDAANVNWINKGFDKAIADKSNGVIVVVQANMDWEGYGRDAKTPEYSASFDNTKMALLTNTLKFKKPVLLQNGDEHWYQVDMPMNETAGKLVEKDKGSLVEYFTRVQTFGSAFNHWVELVVDPSDPNLWSFHPRVIKENLAAH